MGLSHNSDNVHVMTLVDAVAARIPSRLKLAGKLMSKYPQASIHDMKVENVMSGMRGIPCVLWEISQTDESGVKYHGKTLRELEEILPKWKASEQIAPEAMLWFLYTATVPTPAQLEFLAADLIRRTELPSEVQNFCDGLSSDLSPMTQLTMSLAALSRYSKVSAALGSGTSKNELWKHALEDALDGTARVPILVARIHSNLYRQGRDRDVALDSSRDLAHNFACRMGRPDDVDFIELTRLYWALHMDHGSNVSAHAMRLCSSGWTDAYLTLSAGVIAGTGSLHAMAITNSVEFNLAMSAALGTDPSREAVEGYICDTLAKGQIIPGYGHAVLRGTDPRLEFIARFVATHPSQEPMLALVSRMSEFMPELMRMHVPRMRNPAPNVDALSGCVMYAYGIKPEFLVPFMGCSRAMGFLTQYVWDRALGLPIERPLSVTMDEMLAKLES